MPENTFIEIYSLKEKLDKLENEYYHLNDWFGRYDRLIWTLRSLLFTIYAAVIIYSFHSAPSIVNLFLALSFFSVFFLAMEVYWLYRYWRKRTQRYKEIQQVVNECLHGNQSIGIPLLNMDRNFHCKKYPAYAKRPAMFEKFIEPIMFYAGLVMISGIMFYLLI